MEITLSKIALKKSLAVLMAFLIAMSTMWTGLAVVSFERLTTPTATVQLRFQRNTAISLFISMSTILQAISQTSNEQAPTVQAIETPVGQFVENVVSNFFDWFRGRK